MLIKRVSEQERLALLRRAVAAWREAHDNRFVWLLTSRWELLPEEEARDIVREVVRVTRDERDKPIQATYDQEGTTKITSFREHTLFEVLHILRHLDEPLAELLFASHPQLAAAAHRFLDEMESIVREAEERKKSDGERRGGFVTAAGNSRWLVSIAINGCRWTTPSAGSRWLT